MDQIGISLVDASLGLILFSLALTQLGLPVPETPLIVAAGILCQRAGLSLLWPILTCCAAVLVGDVALFYLARTLGPGAFRRRPLRWLLPDAARPRIDALFQKHGSVALFIARFITGVRVCVFVLAGLRGVSVWRFVLWDGLAILVTVPVFAALGHAFGSSVGELDARLRTTNQMLLVLCVVVGVGYLGFGVLWARHQSKRARQSLDASTPPVLQEIPQGTGGNGGQGDGCQAFVTPQPWPQNRREAPPVIR